MTLVVDASALVALLADSGDEGHWATRQLFGEDLVAPALIVFEVANTLRRHEAARLIDRRTAEAAHAELLSMPLSLIPYHYLASRAWELRSNFTVFDAAYVAAAEVLGSVLVTADRRISRGPGVRCRIVTFPSER